MWHLDLKNVLGLQVRKKDIAIKKRKKDIAIKKKKDSIFLAAGQHIICVFILQIKMQCLCSYVAGKTKTYHQTLEHKKDLI